MTKRRWVGCEPWEFDSGRWVRSKDTERGRICSHRDLDVFNLAYTLAMEVFHLTMQFPREERYALVDPNDTLGDVQLVPTVHQLSSILYLP